MVAREGDENRMIDPYDIGGMSRIPMDRTGHFRRSGESGRRMCSML